MKTVNGCFQSYLFVLFFLCCVKHRTVATKEDALRGRNQIGETKREMIKFSSSSFSLEDLKSSREKHQQEETSRSFESQDYGLSEIDGNTKI